MAPSDVIVTPPAGQQESAPELQRALHFPGVLMQSIGLMAPTATLILVIQFTSGYAGLAVPVAFIIAVVIMLLLAVTLSDIARRLPSAGGYYTFMRAALGSPAGVFVAIMLFIYGLSPSMNAAYLANVLTTELKTRYSIHLVWPILFVLIVLGCAFAAYRGIKYSGRALVYLGSVECVVLVTLGVWGLASPGKGGFSFEPFNPGSTSLHGLFLGVIFSIFLFTGWEGAAPVAEESDNPRRNIPRALIGSILLCGAVLVVACWGILDGWGVDRLSSFTASSELPPFILAKQYWGGAGVILLLAVLNSVIVVSLASTIVITRMSYALGRVGIFPAWFGKLHPKYNSPANATVALTIFSLVIGGLGGATFGAANSYFIFGLVITLNLIIVYIAGNYAVARYFNRNVKPEFSWLKHVILPIITSVALVYVGYKSVSPLPAYPVADGIWIAIGWVVVALLIAVGTRHRAREMDLVALAAEAD
jgi:amino acid transporter